MLYWFFESLKSKNQVVHEQKFKDLLSSTCQVSPKRIVFDLESEVMTGPGSIPTGGKILLLYLLFSCCKASDANTGIVANVVCLWKPRMNQTPPPPRLLWIRVIKHRVYLKHPPSPLWGWVQEFKHCGHSVFKNVFERPHRSNFTNFSSFVFVLK